MQSKKLPVAIISSKGSRQLQSGSLWVFKDDIEKLEPFGDEAPLVQVRNKQRQFCGLALCNPASQISLRLLTRRSEQIDQAFFTERLSQAFMRRQRLQCSNQAYRVVHGEADLLPGAFIDRYNNSWSLQLTSKAMEYFRPQLLAAVEQLFTPKNIIMRNDSPTREKEGLPTDTEQLKGFPPVRETVQSNGATMTIDLLSGQKTGTFLDQSENQLRARRYAGGEALDLFCYEGGFALSISPACQTVLACDSSQRALDQLHDNATASKLDNISTHCGDAFAFVDLLVSSKRSFDCIILDPPNFVRNRSEVAKALTGYTHLNKQALALLRPGGVLVSCTCSPLVSEHELLKVLHNAARTVSATLAVLEKRGASPDHPELPGMPQTGYLHCLIVQKY